VLPVLLGLLAGGAAFQHAWILTAVFGGLAGLLGLQTVRECGAAVRAGERAVQALVSVPSVPRPSANGHSPPVAPVDRVGLAGAGTPAAQDFWLTKGPDEVRPGAG